MELRFALLALGVVMSEYDIRNCRSVLRLDLEVFSWLLSLQVWLIGLMLQVEDILFEHLRRNLVVVHTCHFLGCRKYPKYVPVRSW